MTAKRWQNSVLLALFLMISSVSLLAECASASEKASSTKLQNYKPSTIAEVYDKKKIKYLMGHFDKSWKPGKAVSEVKIKSGPIKNVKLQWNELGTQWIVESGKYEIKLSIENGATMSIEDFMNIIRCMPKPALWGLSKAKGNGVQIRDKLGGGSAGCAFVDGVFLAQGRWQSLSEYLLHEASHVLFNVAERLTKTKLKDQWIEAMAADDISISRYADGRWDEDVACFGKIYLVRLMADPKKNSKGRTPLAELERVSPQRFAVFQAIIQEPLGYSLPVAVAANQSVTDTDNNGSEIVQLDGSKSKDKDGKIVKYEWYKNRRLIASGKTPKVKLAVGAHDIILMVTDNDGYVDDRSFIVTVVDAKAAKEVALKSVGVKSQQIDK